MGLFSTETRSFLYLPKAFVPICHFRGFLVANSVPKMVRKSSNNGSFFIIIRLKLTGYSTALDMDGQLSMRLTGKAQTDDLFLVSCRISVDNFEG